jgi:hypothetical protein
MVIVFKFNIIFRICIPQLSNRVQSRPAEQKHHPEFSQPKSEAGDASL